jgi:hypothetical protein
VVLFERWTTSGADAGNDAYTGTYGLVVDATGAEVTALAEIPGQHALGRGDDVVALDGRAVYVTGNGSSLWLNFVDGSLASERVELP